MRPRGRHGAAQAHRHQLRRLSCTRCRPCISHEPHRKRDSRISSDTEQAQLLWRSDDQRLPVLMCQRALWHDRCAGTPGSGGQSDEFMVTWSSSRMGQSDTASFAITQSVRASCRPLHLMSGTIHVQNCMFMPKLHHPTCVSGSEPKRHSNMPASARPQSGTHVVRAQVPTSNMFGRLRAKRCSNVPTSARLQACGQCTR